MPISVGIVGCGWVATQRYIPALRRDSRVRIVAVLDHSPGRAGAVARKYNIPYHATEVEKIIDSVDAVTICTPPSTHAEMSVSALSAGRHVLVEKPMATNSSDAQRMVVVAQNYGKVLCVSHNFLFARSVDTALHLTAEGRIGEIRTVLACQLSSWTRRLPKWYSQLPGGIFYDEAPHMIYLIRRFVGELKVSSAVIRLAETGLPARISVRLEGTFGDASLEMVFGAPISEWLVAVIGSRGVIVIDMFRDACFFIDPDGLHAPIDVLRTVVRSSTRYARGIFLSGLSLVGGKLFFGHDVLIRRFVDAVLGLSPVPVTGTDGLEAVRVLDEILKLGGYVS